MIVAVIDTGIDTDSDEFEGRIHPDSADLLIASVVGAADARSGGPDLSDEDGHGNSIASIIGAARNGKNIRGVAPSAELLIFRADDDSDEDLVIFGSAIQEGITRAGAAGAGVLNLSLGSDEVGARTDFGILFENASSHDLVTVIAAGNEGAANPEESALAALDAPAAGTVIISGSVDDNNNISSFSNRAGTGQAFFLAAPGEFIPVPEQDDPTGDRVTSFSGTSASTPVIAGAAALVREIWPQLSASDVVQVLLTSAQDLGAPGIDEIFGHGLLDVAAALEPSGQAVASSVSGSSVDLGATVSLSPAFGRGWTGGGKVGFLDQFGRDFYTSTTSFLGAPHQSSADLNRFLRFDSAITSHAGVIGDAAVRFRMNERQYAAIDSSAALRAPVFHEGDVHRDAEAFFGIFVSKPVAGAISLGAANGFSPRDIDQLTSIIIGANSLSADGFDDPYMARADSGRAAMLEVALKPGMRLDIVLADTDYRDTYLGAGNIFTGGMDQTAPQSTNLRAGVTFGRERDLLALYTGVKTEAGSVLGADFGGPFGEISQSRTYYQSVAMEMSVLAGWRAALRGSVGVSDVDLAGNGFASAFDPLISTQFAVSLYREGAFFDNDRLTLALLQPLRVEAGRAGLEAPISFDLSTDGFTYARQDVVFGTGPRQLDLEARYLFSSGGAGFIEAALVYQKNAYIDGELGNAATALIRAGSSF